MSRHDMIFEKLPLNFKQAPWTGNGLLGSMMWFDAGRNMIRLQVFRSDVHDHGPFTQGNAGVVRGRLQIGSFYLKPEGKIIGGNWRLDVWNAKLEGTIITDKGKIFFSHFTHSNDEIIATIIKPTKGEKQCTWIWEPAKATTTRLNYATKAVEIEKVRNSYESKGEWITEIYNPDANGEPEISKIGDINISLQKLKYGGEYSTAWQEIRDKSERTLLINITNKYPTEKGNSGLKAVSYIKKTEEKLVKNIKEWKNEHTDWWHKYYQKSFLSLNDTRVETVYWTQIYKMACTTRFNKPMMDTAGMWQTPSPWPYITWDLNVQLCYWLPVGSNHVEEIGMSLINHIEKWKDNLVRNVEPKTWQTDAAFLPVSTGMDLYQPRFVDGRFYSAQTGGNLVWAMHDAYRMFEVTQDKEMLRNQIFPILKKAVNFQFHLLHKLDDGTYGFVNTGSPELSSADNSNYELSTFKWGCQTLLSICKTLNIQDALIPKWKNALDHLVDFPYDEQTGYKVGSNVIFDKGHRHYSHLLQIYPFYLVNIDQFGAKERIKKSVDNFYEVNYAAYKKTGKWGVLAGYTRTGLSSLYSTIGDGEKALLNLNAFIDYDHDFVLPNGLYAETGPVLETPLSAGQAILDMLVQSWGDKIRVFPALPKAWTDVSFENLRTNGAFLISAKREKGITKFVQVKSLAGSLCKIKLDFVPKNSEKIKDLGDGVYQLKIKKDESIVLVNSEANKIKLIISPVVEVKNKTNWFGLNKNRDGMLEIYKDDQ